MAARKQLDNSASHRIQHRLAVVDTEVPDFQGVKNGIYMSDATGKLGHVFHFDQGAMKVKTKGDINLSLRNIIIDEQKGIIIGSTPIFQQSPGSVIIGEGSAEALTVGSDNIFLGRNVGTHMMEGNDLIAIGPNTMSDSSAIGNSIAIGSGSMGKCGKTEMNIGIGKDTLTKINDGYNIAIGVDAGKDMVGPLINHNMTMGRGAMRSAQPSAINIIAFGTQACEEISGNNFQSVYIGDKVAQHLSSTVISVNNVGIGPQVMADAHDVSDSVCIGSSTGKNISGVRLIVAGMNAGIDCTGSLSEEILIGTWAGSERVYSESKSIFIGGQAGRGGSGVENLGVGNFAANNLEGGHNTCVGDHAGNFATGDNNTFVGPGAGQSSSGNNNIYMGGKGGQGVIGGSNIWIGGTDKMGDVLDQSIIIGHDAFTKGRRAIIMGQSAGSSSAGMTNGDVIIGALAGAGQKYGDSISTGKGFIFIGQSAGKGDISSPTNVDSSDLICIGDSAGCSDEQNYHRCVMIGNHAGSFGGKSEDTVLVGHSAGIGIVGGTNICMGSNAGFNLKGHRNIFIGVNMGDRTGKADDLNDIIAVGHGRPVILGDNKRGNLLVGAHEIVTGWVDGDSTLGFVNTERPKSVTTGGVLYSREGELEYMNKRGMTVVSFPRKFVHRGNINGLTFNIDQGLEGSSLLSIKIVPTNKPSYLLVSDVLLNVNKGIISVGGVSSDKWSLTAADGFLTFKSDTVVEGIFLMEVVGDHVSKE